MKKQTINHWAIWTSAIVLQGLPMLWYDKIFFGIRWLELNNLTEADFANFNPLNYIWALSSVVALGYLLAWLFRELNITQTVQAIKMAFILWFGFLFLELATQNAFTLRPFELTLIDELLPLVRYEILAVVLILWKRPSKTTTE